MLGNSAAIGRNDLVLRNFNMLYWLLILLDRYLTSVVCFTFQHVRLCLATHAYAFWLCFVTCWHAVFFRSPGLWPWLAGEGGGATIAPRSPQISCCLRRSKPRTAMHLSRGTCSSLFRIVASPCEPQRGQLVGHGTANFLLSKSPTRVFSFAVIYGPMGLWQVFWINDAVDIGANRQLQGCSSWVHRDGSRLIHMMGNVFWPPEKDRKKMNQTLTRDMAASLWKCPLQMLMLPAGTKASLTR